MWEFQTLISELVGLPIANLSLYDGSTAAAEALTCVVRVHNRKATQKDTVYISELVPPDRMSVMHNYCQGAGIVLKVLRHNKDGTLGPVIGSRCCRLMWSLRRATKSIGHLGWWTNPN